MTAVGIVGPGRAGLGLALALRRAGVRVLGVHGRRRKRVPRPLVLSVGEMPPWLDRADVVVLAVRDDGIAELVRAWRGADLRGKVVLHLSGAQPAAALAGLRPAGAAVAAMHPLMTVSDEPARAAAHFAVATFVLDGDAKAVRAARRLVRRLGGRPVIIAGRNKARYHAGAVFASNYVLALLAVAEDQLVAAGFTRRAARAALAPLARATVDNVARIGPERALTGPILRGDLATIARHLAVLPPIEQELYAVLGAPTIRLARRAGGAALRLAELRRLWKVRPGARRR